MEIVFAATAQGRGRGAGIGTLTLQVSHRALWCSYFKSDNVGCWGFPGGSDGKRVCLQCRRPGFDPWVGKIPWRRKWQPTLVLLPGKSHGWRSLVGYSPWSHKESDMTERLHFTSMWAANHILIHSEPTVSSLFPNFINVPALRRNALNYTHQWVAGSGENFFSNNEELEGNFLRKLNDHITKAVPPW